ncbi:hypothetical protein O6H91_03G131000 [Diphasiastrum complanatum]|uniref:Uncharacterized protein n=1 Tax=Diphasiastrum complanatum TaxID=34168 RepID=A0ACC2EBQ5_DIPCM|nr:hypothetical protein O6H91_03G131000 [Diphasiastrum complanatum]
MHRIFTLHRPTTNGYIWVAYDSRNSVIFSHWSSFSKLMQICQRHGLPRAAMVSSLVMIVAAVLCAGGSQLAVEASPKWINHGGGISNDRHAVREHRISPKSVSKLQKRWTFDAGYAVSATPAIADGSLYFPNWNGNLYAVKASNGALLWQKNLTVLTGISYIATLSRTTPSVTDKLLLVSILSPAMIVAVSRSDGSLKWQTLLDPHPFAVITMSGTPYKGYFYVGVSSFEEVVNASECCTFQGSFHKLRISDGRKIWKTGMLPDNGGDKAGYSGAAIWGSSPAIDEHRKLVYIATGNNYRVPDNVSSCEEEQRNRSRPIIPDPCISPDNHAESMLALELGNGAIRWAAALGGFDAFTVTCLNNPSLPNCPPNIGPDYDFGEAPMLLTIPSKALNSTATKNCDLVVAGQKSGVIWALDRTTGKIIWATVAGPGGYLGGATWGSATDGKRVYTNIANSNHLNFTLVPSNATTIAGGWVAMHASTGKVLWSTASPDGMSPAFGPVTIANNVLFAGLNNSQGTVYAFHAKTGKVLWNASTGAALEGGFSVANGCAFVGSGYTTTPARLVFAFCLPHENHRDRAYSDQDEEVG